MSVAGRHRKRSRSRRIAVWAVRLLVAGLLLFVGVAVGRALEEAPRPGGTQTLVRTLEPDTLPPVTRTVTVTTSAR